MNLFTECTLYTLHYTIYCSFPSWKLRRVCCCVPSWSLVYTRPLAAHGETQTGSKKVARTNLEFKHSVSYCPIAYVLRRSRETDLVDHHSPQNTTQTEKNRFQKENFSDKSMSSRKTAGRRGTTKKRAQVRHSDIIQLKMYMSSNVSTVQSLKGLFA